MSLISKNKNFKDFGIKDPRLLDVFLLVNKKYEERCKEENLLDFDDFSNLNLWYSGEII